MNLSLFVVSCFGVSVSSTFIAITQKNCPIWIKTQINAFSGISALICGCWCYWFCVKQLFSYVRFQINMSTFLRVLSFEWTRNFKSIISTNFYFVFAFKYPMTKSSIWIVSLANYPVVVVQIGLHFCSYLFWGISKNSDFHFYISKELTNLEGIFMCTFKCIGGK